MAARLGRATALCFAFGVAGCASIEGPQGGDTANARVFAVGLADVQRVYIDEIEVDDLALAGVGGLTEIDPDITIERRGQDVQLAFRGESAGLYLAPDDSDSGGWAQLTESMVRDLSAVSPALASAGSERIYESIFDAVAGELDQYSRYASRSEALENRANRDGFGGIGIRIDVVPEGIAVHKVFDDTPAQRSGLKDGDVIVAIDGESAAGIDQHGAVDRLRGPLDSQVTLTVQRGADKLMVSVTRAFIVPQTVTWRLDDDILLLRVEGFNHDTTRALQEAIVEAQSATARPLAGAILDLRGNPGGLLDQSVTVSDLFLSDGTIVTTHGRHPESHQIFEAQPRSLLGGVPLVVLINGYSASASEIVAAALQDNGRALVVGTVSYGKGSVQTLLRLPNEGELTLTWARFHAPSGYPLNGRGVLPDVCTSGGGKAAELLYQARQHHPSATDQRRTIDEKDTTALASFRNACPPERREEPLDVEVAESLLHDPHLYRALAQSNLAGLQN